jgi:hypothetical protein
MLTNFDSGAPLPDLITVMTTPLAFHLAGADIVKIKISPAVLTKTIRGKHYGQIDRALLESIPRAMTDPIMLFRSKSKTIDDSLVAMLQLKNDNGSTVIVSVYMDQDGNINEITSAYPKEHHDRSPNNTYFAAQIRGEKLAYINTDKALNWVTDPDIKLSQADVVEIGNAITKNDSDPLPIPMDVSTHYSAMESLSAERIPNQRDLVKMRDEYPGYYQEGRNAELPRGASEFLNGETIIRVFKNGDRSTLLHEFSHMFLESRR